METRHLFLILTLFYAVSIILTTAIYRKLQEVEVKPPPKTPFHQWYTDGNDLGPWYADYLFTERRFDNYFPNYRYPI